MLRLARLLVLPLALGACAPSLPADAPATAAQSPAPAAPGVDLPDRPLVVMNLAAHPDDEDGQTLATYRGHHDAVAYSVIYTRGEGGQNEAGPDLYERLGAVRTRETEAAARILGTQVFFLNFYDFGFSKHADEAFDEWSRSRRGFWDTGSGRLGAEAGREAVTAEIVRLVRRLKPDVLFTNHDTRTAWPDAQHGQHQVVGLTAEAAFALAADPTYRPDQLAADGVDLWQPARLFVRTGGFSPGTPAAYDVAVPVSVPCAPVADGPAELCSDRGVRAVSEHVSQGFDVFAPRFRRDTTYFVLTQSAPGAPPLPDGATDLGAGLSPTARPLTLGTLVDTGRIRPLPGLAVDDATVLPGGTTTVRPPAGAPPLAFLDGSRALSALGAARPGPVELRIPAGTPPSAPLYAAQYDRRTGSAAPLYVAVRRGVPVYAGRLPLDVVPPLVIDLAPGPVELRPTTVLEVQATPYDPAATALSLHADLDPTATSSNDIDTEAVTLPAEPATAALPLSVPSRLDPGRYVVTVSGALDTSDDPFEVQRPAVRLPDVAVARGLRVGLVRSYDDATEAALRRMGAAVVPLDSAALAAGAFDGLDTIVIDIRAGLTRGDLRAHADRIWAWVEGGGHLVVGYHKLFEWNLDRTNPATGAPNAAVVPLPITLDRDRVVDETAPVTLLEPDHPVFRSPHRIVPEDWDGWVQERGLYFPDTWDPAYRPLVSVGDPGEAPLQGGLLLADYGRGTVAYSALVWYRQLDALHGGAHRVFANLVSLPKTDGR